MAKVKAEAYVDRALTGGYLGTPYKQLDCQAFVEQVLKDCNALSKNWRGSNQMWRDAVYDRSDDMALSRSISVHATATVGRAANMVNAATAEREARQREPDPLIPRLMAV